MCTKNICYKVMCFYLSSRADNKVGHIRILKDGKKFIVGRETFNSLVELICHYKYHPIYRNTVLTHPVNKKILEEKVRSFHYNFCDSYYARF